MDTPTTAIVVNRHAGTVRSMGADTVQRLINEVFGNEADVALLGGDQIEDHIRSLIARGTNRIIVGGGDGTLSGAASLVAETPIELGLLPLGTMNLMAQTIGMEADPAKALQQLRGAEVKSVDAGRANGRLFLHHVAFGLQPRMVRIRERMGYSSRLTKMLAAVRASLAVLFDPKPLRIGLDVDGKRQEILTPGLIVSNNVYENSLMLKQARLDQGVLGVYALEANSIPAFLHLAIDALRGRWRDNANVKELRGRAVRLTCQRRLRRPSRSIKATIDGELTLFDLPLEIDSQPAALRLLVPAATAG